jgi:hypothetical protein
MAGGIRASASAGDLVMVDGYNSDVSAIRYYLGDGVPLIVLREGTVAATRAAALAAPAVWVVRNTRDVSPGGLVGRAEAAVCEGRRSEMALYHPYARWQRAILRLVTGETPPEYFYQVAACRSAPK